MRLLSASVNLRLRLTIKTSKDLCVNIRLHIPLFRVVREG